MVYPKTDLTKAKRNKKLIFSQYWYFSHELEFQKSVCDDSHDLMSPIISDVTVITAKGVVGCIIYDVNKSDAIPFLENSVLNDRGFGHSFY